MLKQSPHRPSYTTLAHLQSIINQITSSFPLCLEKITLLTVTYYRRPHIILPASYILILYSLTPHVLPLSLLTVSNHSGLKCFGACQTHISKVFTLAILSAYTLSPDLPIGHCFPSVRTLLMLPPQGRLQRSAEPKQFPCRHLTSYSLFFTLLSFLSSIISRP